MDLHWGGGDSALSEFWAVLGTGEEISQALAEAWENLKVIGTVLWNTLKAAAQLFFSYFQGALAPLADAFMNTLRLIKAILTGNFDEAWEHFKNLWANVGEFLLSVFSGALNMVYDIFTSLFNGIGDFFSGTLDGIVDRAKQMVKNLTAVIPDFLLPDGLIEWMNSAEEAASEAGANISEATPSLSGSMAESLGAIARAVSSVTNNSEVNANITVFAKSDDAQGIGREVGAEVRTIANTGTRGNN